MNIQKQISFSITFFTIFLLSNTSSILASLPSRNDYMSTLAIIGRLSNSPVAVQVPHDSSNNLIDQEKEQLEALLQKSNADLKAAQISNDIKTKENASLQALVRKSSANLNAVNASFQTFLQKNKVDLNAAEARNKELSNQNESYKKLAVAGGVATSLAVGFIVFNQYYK